MEPAFDGNFVQLIRQMAAAARAIDAFSADRQWAAMQLEIMSDVRSSAARLADKAEEQMRRVSGCDYP